MHEHPGPARPPPLPAPPGRRRGPAPRHLATRALHHIVITFDEGSGSAACCSETPGLSLSHPDVLLPGKNGPGGGRVGAVLLSPLIKPGTISTTDYNHYSLLRTVEDIFGLPHLGDAAVPQVKPFGPDILG